MKPAGRRAAFRRRRTVGAHRADQGLSGSPGRYAALVALLAGLASLPTWAVVQAGARALASGDTSPRPPGAGGSSIPIVVIPPAMQPPGPTRPGPVTADFVYQPAPASGAGGAAVYGVARFTWKPSEPGRRKVPRAAVHPPAGSHQPGAPAPLPVPRQRGGGSKQYVGTPHGVAWSQHGRQVGRPTWSVKKAHHRLPVPPRRGGKHS